MLVAVPWCFYCRTLHVHSCCTNNKAAGVTSKSEGCPEQHLQLKLQQQVAGVQADRTAGTAAFAATAHLSKVSYTVRTYSVAHWQALVGYYPCVRHTAAVLMPSKLLCGQPCPDSIPRAWYQPADCCLCWTDAVKGALVSWERHGLGCHSRLGICSRVMFSSALLASSRAGLQRKGLGLAWSHVALLM